MEDNKITKNKQKSVDACQNVVKWTSEDKKHRGCIVLATDEKSSTSAVIGQSQKLIAALVSAIKTTPSLKTLLTAALMLDMVTGSDTNKDK